MDTVKGIPGPLIVMCHLNDDESATIGVVIMTPSDIALISVAHGCLTLAIDDNLSTIKRFYYIAAATVDEAHEKLAALGIKMAEGISLDDRLPATYEESMRHMYTTLAKVEAAQKT